MGKQNTAGTNHGKASRKSNRDGIYCLRAMKIRSPVNFVFAAPE